MTALVLLNEPLPGLGWTSIDLSESGIAAYDFKVKVSYSHPSVLTFKCQLAHQTYPLAVKSAVILYDSDAGQTQAAPLFEGFVDEVNPGDDGQHVEVTCYDPSRRASDEITIMSQPWDEGNFQAGIQPTEGTGAVPRIVFNVNIDNDDDFAYCRGFQYTVGGILKTLFDDAFYPLHWWNSANEDGTSYVLSQLIGLFHVPQEKIVFESESLRSGLDRMLQAYPHVRYLFYPGESERRFRFGNLVNDTASYTLTLNDFTPSTPNVLTLQLQRTLEGRYTAVKIYGPETTLTETFTTEPNEMPLTNSWSGHTLVPLQRSAVKLETYSDASGQHDVWAYREWQIVDTAKQRGALRLNSVYLAGMGSYNFLPTYSPVLECSYDGGVTWMAIGGTAIDNVNGIVSTSQYMYFWTDRHPPGSSQNYFVPTHWRFTYAYYTTPLYVRWPGAGFEGSAFDIANVTTTRRIYDEMLAVGYEWGVPVTTASRVLQYLTLAQILHDQAKDIVYTGACVLEGLEYDFMRLGKKVNFAAKDSDGNSLTTGWESVNALLTDVEYDFSNDQTTLTFSSDMMELIGWEPETLKEKLKIDASAIPVFAWQSQLVTHNTTTTEGGAIMPGDQSWITNTDILYFNPTTGLVEGAL